MKKYKIFFWVFLIWNVIFIFILLYFVFVSNQNDNIPVNPILSNIPAQDTFDFKNYLTSADSENVANKFPYKAYLKTERYKDPAALKNDLDGLDMIFPMNKESGDNLSAMFNAITDTLFLNKKEKLTQYQPDDLIKILQWGEALKYGAVYDSNNKLFFNAVSDYWLNLLSQKLNEFSKKTPDLKYAYKFRYMKSRLEEGSYIIASVVTPLEKIGLNINQNKWGHLFQASWNQTSSIQKIGFIIFILLTAFCYIYVFFSLIIKKKMKNT